MTAVHFSEIRIWRAEFPLRFAFSHHLASRDCAETLLVVVRTGAGAPGYGQALPRAYLTGESVETVLDDIRDRWWPQLAGLRIHAADFAGGMDALLPLFEQADADRRNASYAALEIAALDAFARERRIPAGFGSGTGAARLPLVGVLSAGGIRKVAWTARVLRWLGYRRFKIKVGRDADLDARRLEAVRRVIGKGAWLAADANAAWSRREAVERIIGLKRFGVSLIEEPVRFEEAADMDYAALERETGVAAMADESLCTQGDARALLAAGSPSWWNVRLAKNGGFNGAKAIAALARSGGATVYGGILVGETSALSAASRAAFFGCGAVCGEYGFPRVFLRGDPFRGGPGGFAGAMPPMPETSCGLGVRTDEAALRRSGARPLWKNGKE